MPSVRGIDRSRQQGGALLTNFLDMDCDVGGVRCVVHLHVDVFFANRLEITGARESREARFERAVIHRVAFAQRNSAAQVAVAKPVKPLKFNPLHDVRWRIVQINRNAFMLNWRRLPGAPAG